MKGLKRGLSSWLQDARVVMSSALVVSVSLAIGHHLFYRSLQGRDISTTHFSQARNLNIATAFTFLVKTCMTIAIGTAYSQILWHTFKTKSLRVAEIDSLSSLPNCLDWDGFIHGIRTPSLLLIALISWLVPIATIFPPGALSVVSDVAFNQTYLTAPTLDFSLPLIQANTSRSLTYTQMSSNITLDDPASLTFPAPPRSIASVLATLTALQGIPRIPGARANTSYTVRYPGPALNCSTAQVYTDVFYCQGAVPEGSNPQNPYNGLYYVSFLKFPQDTGKGFRHFWNTSAAAPSSANGTMACDSITSYGTSVFGNAAPELNMMLLTSRNGSTFGWNATTCHLGNADYTLDQSFVNNEQAIGVKIDNFTLFNNVTSHFPEYHGAWADIDYVSPTGNQVYNFLAMMALMGELTAGTIDWSSDSRSNGLIETGASAIGSARTSTPMIFNTHLVTSPEFMAMSKIGDIARLTGVDKSAFAGPATAPLARQLEELFQNLTVAMMTSPLTSTNTSIPGTVQFSVNRYAYDAPHLLLSYGVGILVTAIVAVLGLVAIAANHAPYSTKYSTFLRTTPYKTIKEHFAKDSDVIDRGADPLPVQVARLRLRLGRPSMAENESETLLDKTESTTSAPSMQLHSFHKPSDSSSRAA